VEHGTATLRLYQWDEPTLSLGYFQPYEDRQQHAASLDSAVVRRSSGGGAILHDRELTYSLALPARMVPDPHQLYLQVHHAIVATLMHLMRREGSGWTLWLCDRDRDRPAGNEPFLCFQRRSRGDVLLERPAEDSDGSRLATDWKIVGSAQRRRRGAILQHGSLLLAQSTAAPELPGLGELTGQAVAMDPLLATLPGAVGGALGVELHESRVPAAIRAAAERVAGTKYASQEWTSRR
jgi:lipoate-protein ligase A